MAWRSPTARPPPVAEAEVVVTMLPAGQHVRAAYTGDGGILASVGGRPLLIDSSTIDVDSARAVAAAARERGLAMLDAPVSGGVGGADAGSLTFMVGGDAEAFECAEPILQAMGKTIVHAGGAGAGQAAKICNNMMLGIQMLSVCEAFALADRLGARSAEAVRRLLPGLGPVLVADHLLPGAGSGRGLAGESRIQAGVHRRHDC